MKPSGSNSTSPMAPPTQAADQQAAPLSASRGGNTGLGQRRARFPALLALVGLDTISAAAAAGAFPLARLDVARSVMRRAGSAVHRTLRPPQCVRLVVSSHRDLPARATSVG